MSSFTVSAGTGFTISNSGFLKCTSPQERIEVVSTTYTQFTGNYYRMDTNYEMGSNVTIVATNDALSWLHSSGDHILVYNTSGEYWSFLQDVDPPTDLQGSLQVLAGGWSKSPYRPQGSNVSGFTVTYKGIVERVDFDDSYTYSAEEGPYTLMSTSYEYTGSNTPALQTTSNSKSWENTLTGAILAYYPTDSGWYLVRGVEAPGDLNATAVVHDDDWGSSTNNPSGEAGPFIGEMVYYLL